MTKALRPFVITVLSLIAIGTFVTLAIMALYNQLIADDVAYFYYFHDGEPWTFLHWHYFGHTGRFLQSILVVMGYWTFGGDLSVKFMPLLLLIALIVVTTWALHRFIPWKQKSLLLSTVVSTALSCTAVLLMPSMYDSYLWWTSSSIYLASLVAMVLTICLTDILFKKAHSKVWGWLFLIPIALGQTLSEITSVVLIGAAGLLLIFFLIKKQKERIYVACKVFAALIIGFSITYFSPGSMTRRASDDGSNLGFDPIRIFILSTRHFKELITSLSLWEIALMVTIGILLGMLLRRLSKKTIKASLWVIGLAIIVGIYGSFCVNNYVWYDMPYRAFTLPSFVLTLSIIGLVALLSNFLFYKYKHYYIIAAALSLILLIGVSVRFIPISLSNINFMMIRNSDYYTRESNISKQLKTGSTDISIEALPIILKSQATDLEYGATEQIWWYAGAIKDHNHIPLKTPITVTAPPSNYCTEGRQGNGNCVQENDNATTTSKVLNKIDHFVIYYLSLNP